MKFWVTWCSMHSGISMQQNGTINRVSCFEQQVADVSVLHRKQWHRWFWHQIQLYDTFFCPRKSCTWFCVWKRSIWTFVVLARCRDFIILIVSVTVQHGNPILITSHNGIQQFVILGIVLAQKSQISNKRLSFHSTVSIFDLYFTHTFCNASGYTNGRLEIIKHLIA